MLSERPWNLLATIRLFLMVLATLCLGMATSSLIEILHLGGSEDQRRFLEMIVMGLSFQFGVIIWIWIYVREAGVTWISAFGLSTGSRARAIVLGLLAGIVFVFIGLGIQYLCACVMRWLHIDPTPQAVVDELSKDGVGLHEKVFFGILSIILAPMAEESLFRGIIYPTIKQLGYRRLALWGTAVLFGVFHANVVSFVPLTIFGVILTLLYEHTDNLLTSICAHSIFNAINFSMLILQ